MSTLKRPAGDRRNVFGATQIRYYPEAASQTFKVGDWLYLVSGKLTIAAAAGNDVGNIKLLGRAAAPATGVTDTYLPVEIADENAIFSLPMYHGTAGSAVTAVTDIGTDLPLRNQGGVWCVNKQNDGTNDRISVIEIDRSLYPVGEQYGVVLGKLLAAHRQVLN